MNASLFYFLNYVVTMKTDNHEFWGFSWVTKATNLMQVYFISRSFHIYIDFYFYFLQTIQTIPPVNNTLDFAGIPSILISNNV